MGVTSALAALEEKEREEVEPQGHHRRAEGRDLFGGLGMDLGMDLIADYWITGLIYEYF